MAWKAYAKFAAKYPMPAWCIQTGLAFGVGDVAAQMLVEKKKFGEIEKKRVARFAGVGFFFAAPLIRGWYYGLDKIFVGQGVTTGLKKMALDQTVGAPLFLANIITLTSALQGQSWEQIRGKLEKDYWTIVKTNWMIWPAVQTINFTLVPLNHRIIVVNMTAVCWNTYLAWKCNREQPPEAITAADEPLS